MVFSRRVWLFPDTLDNFFIFNGGVDVARNRYGQL